VILTNNNQRASHEVMKICLITILTIFPMMSLGYCRLKIWPTIVTLVRKNTIAYHSSLNHSSNKFAVDISRYQQSFPQLIATDKLVDFCNLLSEWNTKINIISRKDIENLVDHHLMPSLAIAKIDAFSKSSSDLEVIDVGTGGGFPGLPLAILFPNYQFTLLDSNGKKITVVNDIVKKLELKNVRTVHGRSEDHKLEYDIVLGRAVSALPEFVGYTKHLLDRSKVEDSPHSPGLIYIKGGDFGSELTQARIRTYELHCIDELIEGLQSDKKILVVNKKQVLSAKFSMNHHPR
jgi:16S rRNA (guanine527-N7)-methyltransferase